MTKLWLCLVSCVLLLCTLTAVAQIQNGQFEGTVSDPTGAAIAGAKVTITNMSTALSVSATSNQSGSFVAKELPPGSYRITTEAHGFKTRQDSNVTLGAGVIQRVNFKMEIGQTSTVVEVSGEAAAVNTDDSKLSTTITAEQIANLPLNGRNVYDLMQMAPGAVNVNGVDMENGHGTVVNGLREDFNGFLINGVANKGLSGGVNNTPIQDTVEEFQQLQLNVSAQYGNSAGSVNNLVTKSGTNALHGSAWEYVRNDFFDANTYFVNQAGEKIPPLRFNQFGGTLGGPIVKDKLFFFASYQGDRFRTVGTPQTVTIESPQFRQAVISALPNSTAALLYKNFVPSVPGSSPVSLNTYAGGNFTTWLCPYDSTPSALNAAANLQTLLGVTAQDVTNAAGTCNLTQRPGVADRNAPFEEQSVAIFGSQTESIGNLFNGNEASGRLDYDWNASNRMYLEFNWLKTTDSYGPCADTACARNFTNPTKDYFPNGQFSFVHTFSPTLLNEVRLGYTQNNSNIHVSLPGVPSIYFVDGTAGFGSYSGYPQVFKEHDYSYSDMVSISHGNHSIKVGADIKRNIENSEFNVARPSYPFLDPLFFAGDAPAGEYAGVDPGFVHNTPAALADNIRHWRNLEFGTYVQDDWKVSKRLTLNLGLRYDLFTRHTELNNLATTFILGPGAGAQQVANANVPLGSPGCNPANPNTAILAGVCGPGGFSAAKSLGKGDHNDFGPRVGLAWDVFGNGKTSLRAGFGVSYESTLYNPLSNSRWNPPYYSFNLAFDSLFGGSQTIIYGPTTCPTPTTCAPSGATPTFLGAARNPGMGTGAQAVGNISGWASANPDTAFLTGIILPQGIRDPYVYNSFFSLQHEIAPKLVVEADYVGTFGHKLFRAQDINRQAGGALPAGACVTDNLGRHLCSLENAFNGSGLPNPNYGHLRTWENAVNSNYHALQLSANKQMSHGLLFRANYTWSHSIDEGSTWHSGATTANGAAGGEGYTTDAALPGLDRGDSIFDIRHRLVFNYVWNLPGPEHGFMSAVLGGWQYNGIWAFQTGAHWSPYIADPANLVNPNTGAACVAADITAGTCVNQGGDFNLDGGLNDRPNSSVPNFSFSRSTWENGWCPVNAAGVGGYSFGSACASTPGQANLPNLSTPCLGCTGNLGRNTFVGPGQWYSDMTIGKTIKITERTGLKFEWQVFNVFNHANFLLATQGGGAHNKITSSNFGKAAGTLNARNMQLGLKLSF